MRQTFRELEYVVDGLRRVVAGTPAERDHVQTMLDGQDHRAACADPRQVADGKPGPVTFLRGIDVDHGAGIAEVNTHFFHFR